MGHELLMRWNVWTTGGFLCQTQMRRFNKRLQADNFRFELEFDSTDDKQEGKWLNYEKSPSF